MRYLLFGLAALMVGSGVISVHPSSATAEIYVPPGLNPGDPYHLAFVSSTFRDAYSSDIADYDAHVQAAADAAGIGVTEGVSWYVIGSTSSVDARDHAVVSAPVYRLDGVKIADGYADLWDGETLAPLSITEWGNPQDESQLWSWTGTNISGMAEVPLGAPVYDWVETGRCNDTDFHWIHSGFMQPGNTLPLYALSERLPIVPEPSALCLSMLGAISVLAFRCFRRRR